VLYRTRRFAAPSIDYLSLYTHQTTQAIEYLSREWPIQSAESRTDRYDLIRIAFATHKPENVSHLYMPTYYLSQLMLQAPQFTRLQRLEVYDDHAVPRTKQLYNFFADLQAMSQGSTSLLNLTELALVMPIWELKVEEYVKPLDLTHWTCLRRLDLLSWRATVDWASLPVANLNDLRLNLSTLSKGFDPAAFFGSCNKLQTLYIHSVSSTTFSWLQQQLPGTDASMPMLTTLEIGGARKPLMLSLTYILEACSKNLESLAIVLQEHGETPYIPENIHWTKLLPKLHSLALKNKAVFEFNPAAIGNCPALRNLTLAIDAEKADPGCTELMSPRFGKWYALLETMKLVGQYGRQLETMRFDGYWIFGGRVALLATESMKHLKSLYLSAGIRSVNAVAVCSLLKCMEDLTLLEVPIESADWNHSEELADLLEQRPDLEVRPTNFSIRF
jgi:hypothetical protein